MNLSALINNLAVNRIEYRQNYKLAPLTTFKIGGEADVLILPGTVAELNSAISFCKMSEVPYFLIGNGSDLLISDRGIEGAVIKIGSSFGEIRITDDGKVYCGAGASLTGLCVFCMEHSLSGLEFAFGIPGSVGGAVYMNAGAYGGEMKDVLVSADVLDESGNICTVCRDDLMLSYRKSAFTGKKTPIIGAVFQLKEDSVSAIREKMDDYMNRRREKQPLDYGSAGSFFKRPEGNFAGTLIEKAGLKGYAIGDAEVSAKHAGFIINKGNATCDEVVALSNYVVKTVSEKFGVVLEPEVIKIGRD